MRMGHTFEQLFEVTSSGLDCKKHHVTMFVACLVGDELMKSWTVTEGEISAADRWAVIRVRVFKPLGFNSDTSQTNKCSPSS
jgi:hypothetical protein